MAYELIICEKPSQAEKIAKALGKPKKETKNKITYYILQEGDKEIYIVSAVGHLYGLDEKQKKGWVYPSFDITWKPSYEIKKAAKYTKPYLDLITQLAKKAETFIVATDFDIEGETIGLNIIRYACKQEDAKRMKFSTYTKEELQEAYQKASAHLDWGQAKAGETR